jgi:hypothetical protein
MNKTLGVAVIGTGFGKNHVRSGVPQPVRYL